LVVLLIAASVNECIVTTRHTSDAKCRSPHAASVYIIPDFRYERMQARISRYFHCFLFFLFFFSSRRRHTRFDCDWSSDVCSSDLERRTDRFLDKSRSHGLPAFLAGDPGVDSGHMIAQYTQAAIVSELKRLAVPASVDSIPFSAMQEDHVSMGWSAARKLRRAIDGLQRVLAVELLS